MLLSELMKDKKDLSSAQQAVVDYMLTQREQLKDMTISEIAKAAYTSAATLIRVAKKFGYDGFIEFKDDFLAEQAYLVSQVHTVDANYPFLAQDGIMTIAHKIATLEKEVIEDTLRLLDHDTLQKAVGILRDAETIHLCGLSFTHLLGDNFAGKMMRVGKQVNVCALEEDYVYSTALVKACDAAIIVSYSGSLPIVQRMLEAYRVKHIPVIAITSLGQSYLRSGADVTLTVTTKEKLYSKIAGFSNETSIKLLLDILYSCYFALDYEGHMMKKRALSEFVEAGKIVENMIISEKTIR